MDLYQSHLALSLLIIAQAAFHIQQDLRKAAPNEQNSEPEDEPNKH